MTDARVRAEIARRRGRLEYLRGRARHADRLYRDAAGLLELTDRRGAALLLVEGSLAAHDAGDTAGALTSARRARICA